LLVLRIERTYQLFGPSVSPDESVYINKRIQPRKEKKHQLNAGGTFFMLSC
jgi:hypothetical protein